MDELLLPLFPLELVLLPEQSLPLHIFEERYKEMIADCLAAQERERGQQQFGIVLAKDEEISAVGCSARIAQVIRRYEDGRLDILAQGTRRFEVVLTNNEKSYLRGSVEFFDDDAGAALPGDADAARAIELFAEAYDLLGNPARSAPEFPPPYRNLSFRIAAVLPLDLDFKRSLLSVRNEAQRLRDVARGLEQLVPRLRALREARRKAGGDGHGYLKT